MELNEKNLPLAKWLIDKTNTKDYRIGNLSGMKHPKVDGDLLKTVGGRDELVRQAKVLERVPALGGEEYLHFDWREMTLTYGGGVHGDGYSKVSAFLFGQE